MESPSPYNLQGATANAENPNAGTVNTTALYQYAANLLVSGSHSAEDVKKLLVAKGMDPSAATTAVYEIEERIRDAKTKASNKDMLFGALWCVGGIIATVANIGFIFWGAIIFGAIQFFKGVANRPS